MDAYLKSLYNYKILSKEEEYDAMVKLKSTPVDSKEYRKILDTIVKSNLRYVVSFAKNYMSKAVEFDDLVAEGNMGLLKGIQDYNPDKKIKGITYFKWWIFQRIILYKSHNSYNMRLPINIINDGLKLTRLITDNKENFEDGVSEEYLAEKLNITVEKVKEIMNYMNSSIDSADQDESDFANHVDFIDTSLMEADPVQASNVDLVLAILSPIQIDIIKRWLGLAPYQKSSNLLEIAMVYDKTSERIRQIKVEAFAKLSDFYTEDQLRILFF